MRPLTVVGIGLILIAATRLSSAQEQPGTHTHAPGTPPHEHPAGPVHTTMDELHQHGGVPPGWQFRFPVGDPPAGRAVFVKLECFACHGVHGEAFPNPPKPSGQTGPELTGMGGHHPAEYLAEKVLNPNAVIVDGPGYTGPDGLSIMPDYRDSLTVAELIDLVAYLKSLSGGEGAMSPSMPPEGTTPGGTPAGGGPPHTPGGASNPPAPAHP